LLDLVGKLQESALAVVLVWVSFPFLNMDKKWVVTWTMNLLARLGPPPIVAPFATVVVGEEELSAEAESELVTERIACC
jgi:hypothetical protein